MQDFEKELDDVLTSREKRREAATEEAAAERAKEDENLEEFGQVRAAIIRPVLEEIATTLKQRGHGASVLDQNPPNDGRFRQASITLNFFPDEADRTHPTGLSTAYVGFALDANTRRISVSESTIHPGSGGHAGSTSASFDLDAITEDDVKKAALTTLRQVFGS